MLRVYTYICFFLKNIGKLEDMGRFIVELFLFYFWGNKWKDVY